MIDRLIDWLIWSKYELQAIVNEKNQHRAFFSLELRDEFATVDRHIAEQFANVRKELQSIQDTITPVRQDIHDASKLPQTYQKYM